MGQERIPERIRFSLSTEEMTKLVNLIPGVKISEEEVKAKMASLHQEWEEKREMGVKNINGDLYSKAAQFDKWLRDLARTKKY